MDDVSDFESLESLQEQEYAESESTDVSPDLSDDSDDEAAEKPGYISAKVHGFWLPDSPDLGTYKPPAPRPARNGRMTP